MSKKWINDKPYVVDQAKAISFSPEYMDDNVAEYIDQIEQELSSSKFEHNICILDRDKYKKQLDAIARLIQDDAWAMTFQSLGQYRKALLVEFRPDQSGKERHG